MTRKIKSFLDPSMEDLPEAVMVDILSRLPAKTIIQCKCVCKNWRNLVSDSYFANLQNSRSPAILMIHHRDYANEKITGYHAPGILKWVEFVDEPDHHHLHHDPVMSLDLNLAPISQNSAILPLSSVNGLLCLWQLCPRLLQLDPKKHDNIYICNPITREYMILPSQEMYREREMIYCFGVGSLSQEYKVIRICDCALEVMVYTLGTGRWRSSGRAPYHLEGLFGAFLNGHAHWIVADHQDSPEKLCTFDFDRETFKLFPSPPSEADVEESFEKSLGVLKVCLCLCDTYLSKYTVWVMKEYGIKKSWRKELVIQQSISYDIGWSFWQPLNIIEGLKDGTIMMAFDDEALFVYCPRRNITVDPVINDCYFRGVAYRPSFHRLQNFENETVHVF